MAGISNDITQINDNITVVNNDVTTLTDVRDLDEDLESQLTVISAEQVLQDKFYRIFTLEQNEEGIFSWKTKDEQHLSMVSSLYTLFYYPLPLS